MEILLQLVLLNQKKEAEQIAAKEACKIYKMNNN